MASDERNSNGKFAKGNAAAAGHRNPNARRVQQFYNALIRAVSVSDIEFVVRKLIKMARSGDIAAIRELLDRCVGRTERIAVEVQNEDETKFVRFSFTPPAGHSSKKPEKPQNSSKL